MKHERRDRESGTRSEVWGGDGRLKCRPGRDAIRGWARSWKDDEGEAVKAVAKSKFEKPRKRRGRKET